jgi:purine-binding chemotaxis protein CheW
MNGDTLDWADLKNRLQRSREALTDNLGGLPARGRAVLRMRAERLARRGRDKAAEGALLPVLVFRVREETYAFELASLVEAAPSVRCTPLPGAPPELVGVTNLRGEIRPVLDAAVLLSSGGEAEPEETSRVLFLRREGAEVGLRVDTVDRVRMIREDDLAAATAGAATASPFVKGVTRDMIIVLDARAFLALPLVGGREETAERT